MKLSKYLVALAFAIIISALFFTTIDLTDVLEKMVGVSLSWIVVSASIQVLSPLVRGWRWKIMLKPVKRDVSFSSTFWSNNVGFMINFLFPIRIVS